MPEGNRFGESTTARSFGASVRVTMPGQGLYLVIGRYHSLSGLVHGVGGQVVLQISARKLLAILPVTAYFAFQRHPDIAFAGPVALDQDRLAPFAALFGHNPSPNPNDEVK